MPTQTHRRLSARKQRLLRPPNFAAARYVDVQKHWRRLGPIFKCETAFKVWKPCMEENRKWRAEEHGFEYRPHPEYQTPADYDSCDWRFNCFDHPRRGRRPAFWDFACHGACHWLVDLNLYVAVKAYPKQPWRILHCSTAKNNHSTVWNGDMQEPLLFDVNFLALGVAASEALQTAWQGRELWVGEALKAYLFEDAIRAQG